MFILYVVFGRSLIIFMFGRSLIIFMFGRSLIIFMFGRSLIIFMFGRSLITIALSALHRFTVSDYPFGRQTFLTLCRMNIIVNHRARY
jgi:hypothetical protein